MSILLRFGLTLLLWVYALTMIVLPYPQHPLLRLVVFAVNVVLAIGVLAWLIVRAGRGYSKLEISLFVAIFASVPLGVGLIAFLLRRGLRGSLGFALMVVVYIVAYLLIRLIVTGRRLRTIEAALALGSMLGVVGFAIRNAAVSIGLMLLALGILLAGLLRSETERASRRLPPAL